MCVSCCVCARVSTRQTILKRFVSFLFQVMMSCPAHPKMQLGWRKWWNSSTTLSLKVRVWNNSPLLQQDASFYWNWTEHLIYMNTYAVIDVVLRLWVFKHSSALLKSSFQLHTYIKLYHSCNSSFKCHLQASFFLSVTNTRWFYLLSCLFFLSSFLHELEGRKAHPWEVSGLPSSFLPHSTVARFCYCCISTMFATLFALKNYGLNVIWNRAELLIEV